MKALLRLYPSAWRDRYGDELEQVLAERPLDLMGALDLIRGALDARLHPALVPATAGGPPMPATVSARSRFPVRPFLATLAAGLFLITGATVAAVGSLPEMIGVQLSGAFLAVSSFVLGLAVLASARQGRLARLAGLVYLAGIVFVTWYVAWLPAIMTIVAGSCVLLLGSLVERRPSRRVGVLTGGLAVAFLGAYRTGSWTLLALVIGAFALVAIALALTAGGSRRPILAGVLATGLAAVAIAGGTLAAGPLRWHDGHPVECSDLEESVCYARIDAVTQRVLGVRPDDRVVWASAAGDGPIEVCTEPPASVVAHATAGDQSDAYGPLTGNGVSVVMGTVGNGFVRECWRPDGPWAWAPSAP
ncbi:MAG: hypothetical protein U0869_23845 [Chloroflexota bacterium]